MKIEEKFNHQVGKQGIQKNANINLLRVEKGIAQSSSSNINSNSKITNVQSINDKLTNQMAKKRTSNMKVLDCSEQINQKPVEMNIKNVTNENQKMLGKHKKKTTSQKKLQIEQSKNITFNTEDQDIKGEGKKQQTIIINKGMIVKNNVKTKNHQIQSSRLQNIIAEKTNEVEKNKCEEAASQTQQKNITCRGNLSPTTSSPAIKSLKSFNGNEEDFDNVSRKTKETFRSSHSSCKDYLSHIFEYYCKVSYSSGKESTFDSINQKLKSMTITNFMIFCKEFKLRECFERQTLVQTFKKYSDYQKHMNADQFHSAIENLSNLLYKDFEEEKRFGKMLIYLKIHNSFSFVKKMNQLGQSFRMKNKRGIEVNLTEKYNFKLTMINGKCLEQIQQQVKERSELRKEEKQKSIQWHKKNRTNKIDQLYKNGVKGNKEKEKYSISKVLDSGVEKVKNGYYNPCQFLSHREEKTYKKINQLKKYHTKSLLKKQQTDRIAQKMFNLDEKNPQQQYSQIREMKVHSIIKMAKNTIKLCEEKENKNVMIGCIKKQITADATQSYGTIKHQIIENTTQSRAYLNDVENLCQSKFIIESPYPMTKIRMNLEKRNSKQLKAAQFLIESQLKSIPQTVVEMEHKPKQFLRATAQIQRQNNRQLYDLEQMIGVFNGQEDEILTKHFMMERKHELNLRNREE